MMEQGSGNVNSSKGPSSDTNNENTDNNTAGIDMTQSRHTESGIRAHGNTYDSQAQGANSTVLPSMATAPTDIDVTRTLVDFPVAMATFECSLEQCSDHEPVTSLRLNIQREPRSPIRGGVNFTQSPIFHRDIYEGFVPLQSEMAGRNERLAFLSKILQEALDLLDDDLTE